ncbi:MAG: hypothetical protein GKR88_10955 [Flavobacteriaceae bacterium]|nr:MAG: hypothetical protein GKR88_10955 [Flavobacteriaceae bacterium]
MENNKNIRLKRLGTVLVDGMINSAVKDSDFRDITSIETEAINPRSAKIAKNSGMKKVTSY